MAERTKRVRPSRGDWADRSVTWLAGKNTWVFGAAMLAGGAIACAAAALLIADVSWHELLAWFASGTFLMGLLVLAATAVSLRGRDLVEEARSLNDLVELPWRQFEELMEQVFRSKGWTVARTQPEADGGADLILRRRGEQGLAQCKKWRQDVPVLHVRAFYGVMAGEKAKTGFFVTTSAFTPEAERFAKAVGIQLIWGRTLLREVATARGEPLPTGPRGVPSCPVCGSATRLTTGPYGRFWGCSRFPDKCDGWLRLGLRTPGGQPREAQVGADVAAGGAPRR
jgi:HJR/Mrr/RecB family endonuclease